MLVAEGIGDSKGGREAERTFPLWLFFPLFLSTQKWGLRSNRQFKRFLRLLYPYCHSEERSDEESPLAVRLFRESFAYAQDDIVGGMHKCIPYGEGGRCSGT